METLKGTAIAFSQLGLTAFGGPTAHLAYFHREFVSRRQWVNEENYASLVAISQFLPGPASSKVSQAIGYHRGSWGGLVLSWLCFTLPSALIMAGFGMVVATVATTGGSQGWIRGLLAAAVAVVAHAILGMARKLIHTTSGFILAVLAAAAILVFDFPLIYLAVIVCSGLLGATVLRRRIGTSAVAAQNMEQLRTVGRTTARICGLAFFGLLVLFWALAELFGGYFFSRLNAFYQAGALVFGGGHVVLPMLEGQFVSTGWVNQEDFLAGYSLAQAVPGPMFTLASYLGAVDGGLWGALLGTVVIFLPGTLLMIASLHYWNTWRQSPILRTSFAGINSAVVGILLATWWDPVFIHGVTDLATAAIALVCFAVFWGKKIPAWLVAGGAALAGLIIF